MKTLPQILMKMVFVSCFLAISITTNAQILDLESTTEGALLPRMTTAQRIVIAAPSQAETVYDTDTKSFWYWEDAQWNELGTNAAGGVDFFECGEGISGDTLRNTLAAVRDTISMTSTDMITSDMEVIVCLDITHTYVDDLDINLISPSSGSTIDLTSDNGGNSDNFSGTCFSMSAKTSITSISPNDAPFTNIYQPEQSFAALIGQSINGDWTLEITDDAGGDDGFLNSWTLYFTNNYVSLSGNSLIANRAIAADSADVAKTLSDLGTFDFGSPGEDNIQLYIAGKHNEGLNSGSPTGTYKLKIDGYDNDVAANIIYPILAEDENGNVDFYIKGRQPGIPTLSYFGGQVAIGTEVLADGYSLSVDGKIACEEVLVELNGSWPDYVFRDDYQLLPLAEVESHINKFGHLPNVPSANEVEGNGLEVGEMNKILMEKVEELTLYIIELEKKYSSLEEKLENK